MTLPLPKSTEEEVDDYESDEYDSGEDDDGEYQETGELDDEVDEEDDEAGAKGSLTALLVAAQPDNANEDEDEDEDEAYVPGGGVDPADEEVDGDKHDLPAINAGNVDDVEAKSSTATAVGLKRKTSGDENDEEEEEEEGGDTKRVKPDA